MLHSKFSYKKIARILGNNYAFDWGRVKGIEISQFQQGYMNNVYKIGLLPIGQYYVLILYNASRYSDSKSQLRLEKIYSYVELLDKKGLPVSSAVVNKDNTRISTFYDPVINRNRLFSLHTFRDGEVIPWETYEKRHLRALGRTLRKLHIIWKNIDELESVEKWGDYFEKDSTRVQDYLNSNRKVVQEKLNYSPDKREIDLLNNAIRRTQTLIADYQLIHCDFVRGNILFSKEKQKEIYPITGILDFEKVLCGPIEVDAARTYAFLLVDCKYKKRVEIDRYFLAEGYLNGAKEDVLNKDYFVLLVKYFLLRDFYKFLDCNPYENLSNNEHFVRTVEYLKKLRLVL